MYILILIACIIVLEIVFAALKNIEEPLFYYNKIKTFGSVWENVFLPLKLFRLCTPVLRLNPIVISLFILFKL